jgi:repressor LexA
MLSRREQDTYNYIRAFFARHGHAPTLEEIAEGLGIRSKGVVHRYLRAIAEDGLITLVAGRHRGILLNESECSPTGNSKYSLPLVGKIAAGQPIEAIPDQEHIDLAEFLIGPNRFVLKVQGDSMCEAGILDGDMVVVERCNRANNGDIVVALIDHEEATLKTLRNNHDGSVMLIPANSAMTPMIYPAERVAIQGVVVGQMRSYR